MSNIANGLKIKLAFSHLIWIQGPTWILKVKWNGRAHAMKAERQNENEIQRLFQRKPTQTFTH